MFLYLPVRQLCPQFFLATDLCAEWKRKYFSTELCRLEIRIHLSKKWGQDAGRMKIKHSIRKEKSISQHSDRWVTNIIFWHNSPHPSLILTMHSVCLAEAGFIALFSRNKITISACKSKKISHPPQGTSLAVTAHLGGQCQPSVNGPGGSSSHSEKTSGCRKAPGNLQQQIKTRWSESTTSPAIKR